MCKVHAIGLQIWCKNWIFQQLGSFGDLGELLQVPAPPSLTLNWVNRDTEQNTSRNEMTSRRMAQTTVVRGVIVMGWVGDVM